MGLGNARGARNQLPGWFANDPRRHPGAGRTAAVSNPDRIYDWDAYAGRNENDDMEDDMALHPGTPEGNRALARLRAGQQRLPDPVAPENNPYLVADESWTRHPGEDAGDYEVDAYGQASPSRQARQGSARVHTGSGLLRQHMEEELEATPLSRERNETIEKEAGVTLPAVFEDPDEGSPFKNRPYSQKTFAARIGMAERTLKDQMRTGRLPRLGKTGKVRDDFKGPCHRGGRDPRWYGDQDIDAARLHKSAHG